MRPLPRLHAVTDHAVLALEDLGVRAAALAAAGSVVALHARDREATGARLTAVAQRFLALAGPPEAAVFVNGRPDIAAALGAQGIQLGVSDLLPHDARKAAGENWPGWIGSSVHSGAEARAALDAGADFLMVGHLFETPSHSGQPAGGLPLLTETLSLGLPVIAMGDRMTDPPPVQQQRVCGPGVR